MNKRKFFLIITAVILTSVLSGSLGAATVLAWPFGDVHPGDWFAADVQWLDANNITHGCGGGNYCPNANVTRAEMAAFLHRQAGMLASAGVHVVRDALSRPVIADWFNNLSGVAPTILGTAGFYSVVFGFDITTRYPICTIDGGTGDMRNTVCSVYAAGNAVTVFIWDVDNAFTQPADFYLVIFGQ
jgi:hypothetical protein